MSFCKITRSRIVFYNGVCSLHPHIGGCKRPVGTIITFVCILPFKFNLVAPIWPFIPPLSLLHVRRRWKVDCLCLIISCSRLSEPFALLPILPLLLSGYMLSSGGYYLETFLHQGGNLEELLWISPKEIKGTGNGNFVCNNDKTNPCLMSGFNSYFLTNRKEVSLVRILVWEDGFCDFNECEQRKSGSGYLNGRFGADVFFKMSHEVYNYGEGLVGKVAADNSHKWVYNESHNECESSYIASWNASVEPQPKAWEFQFNSGIQSIVIIAVKEGVVQLGSFNKIAEDLNLVISIQRQFSYLQSIPGVFGIQRPYLPLQNPYIVKPSFIESNAMPLYDMGWNTNPQNGAPGPSLCSGSPLPLPTMPCSFGALLSKLPSGIPPHNSTQVPNAGTQSTIERVKIEDCEFHPTLDDDHKGRKVGSLNK